MKKELQWISSHDPFISKLYRQDIRFNNGAQFKRSIENLEETLPGRERRAAGKDESGNVGAFYDVGQTDFQALPRKFKLYMVGTQLVYTPCSESATGGEKEPEPCPFFFH